AARSDDRNEEGDRAGNGDLVAHPVNDGRRVPDGDVDIDARKNVAHGLVMNVGGAEKRIRSPVVYREAEIGVRDLSPNGPRILLKSRADRCIRHHLFYNDRRRNTPERRSRHRNAVPADRKFGSPSCMRSRWRSTAWA